MQSSNLELIYIEPLGDCPSVHSTFDHSQLIFGFAEISALHGLIFYSVVCSIFLLVFHLELSLLYFHNLNSRLNIH